MRRPPFLLLLVPLLMVALLPSAVRAGDGPLGSTSTGTLGVSLTMSALVKLTDVADLFDFGTYSGSGDPTMSDDVCVWTNGAGSYTVKGTGSGTDGVFTVNDGQSHTIPFSVSWKPTTGQGSYTALNAGETSGSFSGASTDSVDCSVGGLRANFRVSFTQVALLNSPAGTYTGTVSLLIAPP